jgi:hypothetical protein
MNELSEKKMVVIPAGSLLTISVGAYSDYTVYGVFRALKDIDAEDIRDRWLTNNPQQGENYHFDESEFLGWVTREGFLEPIESFEWHLADYSNCSEMWVDAPGGDEEARSSS